jgi:hypothetical protein
MARTNDSSVGPLGEVRRKPASSIVKRAGCLRLRRIGQPESLPLLLFFQFGFAAYFVVGISL